MKITYDIYNRTEPSHIFIARPGKRILGELNGIKEETCNVEINLNNTSVLTFDVDRIVDGEKSNYYDFLEQHYELYVTGIGWFKINEEPQVYYDGNTETTSIRAESLEIELQQYDLTGFKVNCGTEDSWEMMAVDNIYTDSDGYKLPRESVLFYRDTNSLEELISSFSKTGKTLSDLKSLLYDYPTMLSSWRITLNLETYDDALSQAINEMKENGKDTSVLESFVGKKLTQEEAQNLAHVHNEIFKYVNILVDTTSEKDAPYSIEEILDMELKRQHQLSLLWLIFNEHGWSVNYIDDYVDTTTPLKLSDMVGKFEIDSQDIYSFITQDIAKYFKCLFMFNTNNYTVDIYKLENLGNDTNIFLGFNNVQNSITKNSDRKIYTVYHVSNDDELNLREVNFGEDALEDISYFLTTKHFSQEFINKYNNWRTIRDSKREEYSQLSKDYRNQNDIVTEIYYRVPTDLVDTSQYSTFSNDELLNERAGCEAQLKGYESLYIDADGNFDLAALQDSPDWKTYKLIKEIVIQNINIELYNRGLDNKEDYLDFNDDYEYDFNTYGDSYGVKELEIYRDTLKNNTDLLAEKGYDKVGEIGDEYHAKQHELYLKYLNAYNSCISVLNERQTEYDNTNKKLDEIQAKRFELQDFVNKKNPQFNFTEKELLLLDKYYIHTDYINQNIVTTSLDDNNYIIDKINELYKDAEEQLYSDSHPQWNWSTTQDNLLIMPEFKDWHDDLDIANFIRVSIRDDYQVKLRIISISLNPFMIDSEIQLTFSNMVQYKSRRNDYDSIIGFASSSGKNQITSAISSNKSDNDTFNIDANLVRKLINNGSFSGYMNGIISDYIQANNGSINNLVTQKLDAIEINVNKITGTTAEFDELFSKYIDSDYINSKVVISDKGEFIDLSALVAQIDNLLAGKVSTELGHIIELTADTVHISEAVIRDIIAAQITVSMLKASDISSDTFHILSDDGGLEIIGNTMQFKDVNGNVRIQIGRDSNNNFTFTLYDANGTGVLIDENGIHDSAISDGLIKNDMIADGTLSKDKLGFEIIEPNEHGGIDITKVYDGKGGLFGVEYNSFKESTQSSITTLSEDVSALSDMVQSVELIGNQVFVQNDDGITPSSITITAMVKNGLSINKWYIDNIENTEYVSSDKLSFTIPSSAMENKKTIVVKAEGTDTSKYDLFTVYKVIDGSDAYTVTIVSNNGTTFKMDSDITSSIASCTVYKGSESIEPKSYTWYCIENNGNPTQIGTGKSITLPLSKEIIKKTLYCEVDI